jgi:hypothetical protein
MSPSSSRSLPARAGCIDPNGGDRKSKSREATLKLDAWHAPGPFSRLAGDPAQEYLQATRRYGAGMRSLLVILIFLALAEPAAACRRFSIWHYNFPQPPCPIDSPEAQAAPAPAAPDIPLPDLTEIIWGETGDGRLVAIGKLRVLGSGR